MSLFLAMTSTWASSETVQDRKSQAASAFLVVAETPIESPPTNVDSPPSGPGMGATPIFMSAGIRPSVVDGIGMTPISPLGKKPVQVGPCSSLAVGPVTPFVVEARARSRTPPSSPPGRSSEVVPSGFMTWPPAAQTEGQKVKT